MTGLAWLALYLVAAVLWGISGWHACQRWHLHMLKKVLVRLSDQGRQVSGKELMHTLDMWVLATSPMAERRVGLKLILWPFLNIEKLAGPFIEEGLPHVKAITHAEVDKINSENEKREEKNDE